MKADEMVWAFSTHASVVKYIIFVGESEVKRPLRRPKRRWKDSKRKFTPEFKLIQTKK
jgi:hypothetical protein